MLLKSQGRENTFTVLCFIFCLGNEQRSFCHFWDCTQVLHFGLCVNYEGYSISSKGFLPTIVDILVFWIKFTMVFLVVMYGCKLDYKESWALKDWWFWTVVLEKTLENPLDCKEIQLVHPKENQSWIFIGRWNSNTLATWCKELTHWIRPWCWERLRAGGEGNDRGWDG